jgi:hypothetical protein
MHERSALMAAPCEDGINLLTVAGPADLTRGNYTAAIEARYRQAPPGLPAVLNPRLPRGRRAGLTGDRRTGGR